MLMTKNGPLALVLLHLDNQFFKILWHETRQEESFISSPHHKRNIPIPFYILNTYWYISIWLYMHVWQLFSDTSTISQCTLCCRFNHFPHYCRAYSQVSWPHLHMWQRRMCHQTEPRVRLYHRLCRWLRWSSLWWVILTQARCGAFT